MSVIVKLCRDCKHSREGHHKYDLRCHRPDVIAKDQYALSSGQEPALSGSSCSHERGRGWPSPCGMRGAMWERKP